MNTEKQYKEVLRPKQIIEKSSNRLNICDNRPQYISQHKLIENIQRKQNRVVQLWEKDGINKFLDQPGIGRTTIENIKDKKIPVEEFKNDDKHRGYYYKKTLFLNESLKDDQAASTIVHEVRHAKQLEKNSEAFNSVESFKSKIDPIVDNYIMKNHEGSSFSTNDTNKWKYILRHELDAHLHQSKFARSSTPPIDQKSDRFNISKGETEEILTNKIVDYLLDTYLKQYIESLTPTTDPSKKTTSFEPDLTGKKIESTEWTLEPKP